MPVWDAQTPPPAPERIGLRGWGRVAGRGGALLALLLGGLGLLGLLRLAEWPLSTRARPLSGRVPVWVSRGALRILGLEWRQRGAPMAEAGAVVANHASWLDILVLNAAGPVTFVAKQEVAGWAFIGWLARATGTLFIRRDPRLARAQVRLIAQRLERGHRLLFFPEGTSTDGLRVLPFKSTLFAPFLSLDMKLSARVQPVSIAYRAPPGRDRRFYGWWGSMDLAGHLLQVLAVARQGAVTLDWHPPLRAAQFADRKALALACERAVAAGLARAGAQPLRPASRPGC